MSKQQTIEERITYALHNGGTGSATLAELIKEIEVAIEQASETAEQERARARDLLAPIPIKPIGWPMRLLSFCSDHQ
jgi:hypothetical protein